MTDLALIPVCVGACLCPGTPHADGDFVYLRPKLDLRGGIRVKRRALDLNKAEQVRRIQVEFAAGRATVNQLADQLGVAPGDVQDIVDNKGDLVELMNTDREDLEIALAESYLTEGIAAWNLIDEDGKDREIITATLEEHLFSDYSRAEVAADKADDLYRGPVLDPLFQRALSSYQATQTKKRTPATNGLGSKRPKRSKRSSTSTSQTADTTATPISPAGASSS